MQRDCQLHLWQVVHEPPHVVDDANRGHGNAAWCQAKPMWICQAADGRGDAGVILQRLPHAHEDNIAHRPYPAGMHKLLLDLARPEVPLQAHGSGGAEGAAEPAAHLRGDAEGVALAAPLGLALLRVLRLAGVVDEHGLNLAAILQTDEQLDGAVDTRLVGLGHRRRQDGKLLAQRLAQPVGYAGHLAQRRLGVLEGVAPDPCHVHRLGIVAGEESLQRGFIEERLRVKFALLHHDTPQGQIRCSS
mmetsp:Transcript_70500/g.170688  ORF Transcript_70500/g.170688 Transcript_70500/m.170688 type:complete len:246 (-) Transcript_70500:1-738(-)